MLPPADCSAWHAARFSIMTVRVISCTSQVTSTTTGEANMLTKRIAAAVVTVLGMSFGAGSAKAEHIDDLAATLQRQSRALESEFAAHFRHSAHFRHLISDSREMAGLAAHIHEVAHHG